MPADENTPLSLDEVVSDLIVAKPEPPARPNGKAAAGETTAPEGADESEDDRGPREPVTEPDDGTDQPQPEGDEPEDDEDDDEDPTYEVKVSGRTQAVKLSQLLATWSGEQTIAARLQEATEARNAAQRARDVAVEQERGAARQTIEAEQAQLRQTVSNLAAIYSHYGDAILAPRVQPPDPSLRATDPIGYLTQVEAYRAEVDRLGQQRQHMTEVVQQSERLEHERTQAYVKEQAAAIVKEVPAMADPTYRRTQIERVQKVGEAVGFSADEIRRYTTDRRTIYLAMLAAEGFEAIMARQSPGKVKAQVQKPAGVPAPTARVRTMASVTAKRKAARERARKSGDVEDVAQTLIVPAPRKGHRRPQA